MQNERNRAKPPTENGFQSRQTRENMPRVDSRTAVRQGRTDVITGRQIRPQSAEESSVQGKKTPPRLNRSNIPNNTTIPRARSSEIPRQVVIGKPKSEKTAEQKAQPVIVDSPNIDSPKYSVKADDGNDKIHQSVERDKRKFYFQSPKEISTLRKMLILVFGFLFLWSIAPAFFHIRGIGVISSSIVMLGICLTALFWHLIDRNWTFKKAVVVLCAAAVFTACVVAFSIVSGMMLKASLTAVPDDCENYTVVVLGCKAHGDQPSWMLNDRLEKAYSLLSQNPNVKCVVTGGMGDDEQYTESYVMRKYLVEKGISPDRIYVEDLAESTEENLLYSKALIRLNGLSENIVIVTDRFHELRARIWAEKSGFKNIYSACCETRVYLVIGYWFREMFGLARLYVFGI